MHVLEDSAIFSALQQQQKSTKGNDGRGRTRRMLRILFISSICVLFCFTIYMLHGMISSLEDESIGESRGHNLKSVVGSIKKKNDANANNASGDDDDEKSEESDGNNSGYDIDEGILIDFHVANLGGIPQNTGVFTIQTKPSWSQLGAERFTELTLDSFWDDCRFFRAINNFIVQWGINGKNELNQKWASPIDDEGVKESNSRGTVSFAMAGPGTRSHQMFINLKNNKYLDGQGFAPVAKVISGMDVVDQMYTGYGEKPKQNLIRSAGNKYLNDMFPKMTYIVKAVPK